MMSPLPGLKPRRRLRTQARRLKMGPETGRLRPGRPRSGRVCADWHNSDTKNPAIFHTHDTQNTVYYIKRLIGQGLVQDLNSIGRLRNREIVRLARHRQTGPPQHLL